MDNKTPAIWLSCQSFPVLMERLLTQGQLSLLLFWEIPPPLLSFPFPSHLWERLPRFLVGADHSRCRFFCGIQLPFSLISVDILLLPLRKKCQEELEELVSRRPERDAGCKGEMQAQWFTFLKKFLLADLTLRTAFKETESQEGPTFTLKEDQIFVNQALTLC